MLAPIEVVSLQANDDDRNLRARSESPVLLRSRKFQKQADPDIGQAIAFTPAMDDYAWADGRQEERTSEKVASGQTSETSLPRAPLSNHNPRVMLETGCARMMVALEPGTTL